MGATGLKKLWDFIRGKNKTPKASKTKEKSPGKGEKASTKGKASKTKAKSKAKKVPKVKPRKIGRGKLGSALSATGLVLGGIGATTVLSDAEEEDSALMTGIDAAANGLWYYEGGKDAGRLDGLP